LPGLDDMILDWLSSCHSYPVSQSCMSLLPPFAPPFFITFLFLQISFALSRTLYL
jgi:hypothetical protein